MNNEQLSILFSMSEECRKKLIDFLEKTTLDIKSVGLDDEYEYDKNGALCRLAKIVFRGDSSLYLFDDILKIASELFTYIKVDNEDSCFVLEGHQLVPCANLIDYRLLCSHKEYCDDNGIEYTDELDALEKFLEEDGRLLANCKTVRVLTWARWAN